MKGIRVTSEKLKDSGRLYPKYDDEADLLEVSSEVSREWSSGIDVDGNIVFDVSLDGTLVNFDLLIPKHLWKVVEVCEKPQVSHKASLKLSKETLKQESFNLQIDVKTDKERSCVLIIFGPTEPEARGIELSKSCMALTKDDRLVGFFVSFS